MFCTKCGEKLPDGSTFCPKCGAKVAAESTEAVEQKPVEEVKQEVKPVSNELLFRAKRSVWACSKRVISGIVFTIVVLAAAVAMFIMSSEQPIIGIALIGVSLIGVVVVVFTAIEASRYEILFYEGKIVVRSGLLSRHESQSIMTPVVGVRVEQSFWGRIFNYGTIVVDKTGKGWDINTSYLKNPEKIKAFLEDLINKTDLSKINMHISN